MQKDVIYIDVDDDITAIIGKIKKAKEKVVAIVPPKRIGALQSAVNLRLLDRMAKAEKKHLVLVTNNQALVALSAAAKIPVAKNLQSKPELPEVAALVVDGGDDIIDGAEIPVGEHAEMVSVHDGTKESRSNAIEDVAESLGDEPVRTSPRQAQRAKKGTPKIPDFDTFRKKLFLIIGGGVGLVALLIWMFVFAPAATVIITARTSPQPVSTAVTLGGTAATNHEKGIISSITQQEKKDIVIEFEATGQQDVGEKATGSMQLTRTSVSSMPISIPSGTKFTSGALVFLSTEAATLGGTSIGPGGIVQDSVTVGVQALNPGENYNVSARSYSASVGGFSSYGTAMKGGTSRMARVVSEDDIERARGQLLGESTDSYKDALTKKLTNGEKVVDGSFVVERGKEVILPELGKEAKDGKATLTVPTTFSIQAVPRAELETFLKRSIEANMDDKQSLRVFDTGADKATIGNFRQNDGATLATINATGRVGPKIDEAAIKEQAKGKIYGEIQSTLQAQSGISSVDVNFSYFWVRTVPNDANRITVEFRVEDE